ITSVTVDGNDAIAVFEASRAAVAQCRAGNGPVLIEAKTMRMKGHAQHDPAEYVPKAMREYWEARDPIVLFEKYLNANKLWDARAKQEIEARIAALVKEDLEFAENSPMPPAELAEQGVYCEGCHTIEAEWHRPKAEVTPPKSSVAAGWNVKDFGGIENSATGGNGASARPAASPMHLSAGKAVQKSSGGLAQQSSSPKKIAAVPERRPFGRGPKGKKGGGR
ncbi:MAG: thiamine pyrophosphate-dependent enzyme, partial [Candidatus Acidiferrales bacterium]